MAEINYKHLRYFWMVGKLGSIAKASQKLFITPQSISAQIAELETNFGGILLRKVGRGLELSILGRQVFNYADEIFTIGSELSSFIENKQLPHRKVFRIGISDCISRSVALSVIKPVFEKDYEIYLNCKQDKLSNLLSDLSVNKIDAVISDREVPENLNISLFNHNLGSSQLAIYGKKELIEKQGSATFPELLNNANFLMPGDRFLFKDMLIKWLESNKINPNVIAEFDDSALIKLFGQRGDGFFVASHSLSDFICSNYNVELVGVIDSVFEKIYAITTERQLKHPGMLKIIKSRVSDY